MASFQRLQPRSDVTPAGGAERRSGRAERPSSAEVDNLSASRLAVQVVRAPHQDGERQYEQDHVEGQGSVPNKPWTGR